MNAILSNWKTTIAGIALAVSHVAVNGVGWKQLVHAALLVVIGALAKDADTSPRV